MSDDQTLLEPPKQLVSDAQEQKETKQQEEKQKSTVEQTEQKQQVPQVEGLERPFAIIWLNITKYVVAFCAACQIGSFVCSVISFNGSLLQKISLWYIQIINIIYLLILFVSMVLPITTKIKQKNRTLIFGNPLVIMLALTYISLYNMNQSEELDFKGDTQEVTKDVLFVLSLIQIPFILVHIIVAGCSRASVKNWYLMNQKKIEKPLYL